MNHLLTFSIALAVATALALAGASRYCRHWLERTVGRYDLTGIIVVVAMAAGLLVTTASTDPTPLSSRFSYLSICTLAVLAVGVAFDVRPTRWYWRGLAIAAIALLQTYPGFGIDTLKVPFAESWIDLGAVGPVITALWITLFAGLFGRAATIRGVPAGIALVSSATFFAICTIRPDLTEIEGQMLAAAVAGTAVPVAVIAPSLRNAGATSGGYVLGFLVGVGSVAGAVKNTAFLIAAIPLMVLGAPLFDVAYTYVSDLRAGWGAMATDRRRRHLHEILINQGYSQRQVLGLIIAATTYLCAIAILLVYLIEISFVIKLLIIIGAVAIGLPLLYFVLRMMPRKDTDKAIASRDVSILGIKLHPVTMQQALRQADQFINEDEPHIVVTADTCGLMRAYDDPEFRDIVNGADLVTADGAGVVLAARLLNIPIASRCAGVDMVTGLCRVAADNDRPVYLLGAKRGVAEEAADNLQQQVPDLQIAGCHHGYFSEDEEDEIIECIKDSQPAVLFVALGSPRQEKWIRNHLQRLDVPVCVGVGGSFDVISGRKKRAPVWMQRFGIEWVYRAIHEPHRIPRLKALPRIVILTAAELLKPPQQIEK